MAIFHRIANLFSRSKIDQEIHDELHSHIEMRIEDNIANGMSPEEARRDALLRFGNPVIMQEKVAHMDAALGLDTFFRDVHYAWRMLSRSKGFTAVAVGSLALGIGANTIIFSLAKGVLLDRLAVPKPERLKLLTLIVSNRSPIHRSWGNYYDAPNGMTTRISFSYPVYQMLRQQNREHPALGELFAYKLLNSHENLTMTLDGHADTVNAQIVSGNYYQQLGVKPQLGRPILPADDGAAGTGNVVVISDGIWAKFFGRSPNAIGKTIAINLIPMTIVGVNPPGFTGAASVQISPDIFFPFSMAPILLARGSLLESEDLWWVQVMGRALPNISNAKAQSALRTWLSRISGQP